MSIGRLAGGACAALLFGACSGELTAIGSQSAAGADAGAEALARAAFDTDVAPLLQGFCASCHGSQATVGVGFLEPDPDVYTSVMSWPTLVDVDAPPSSRLLTKGAHDGPAWTAEQRDTIAAWIELESIAAGNQVTDAPETAAFSPVVGANTVDLTPIGLDGSTITFRLEKLQVGFYISELMLNAGSGGAHIVHPLFVVWTAGAPSPDAVDRFGGVEVTAEPGQSAMIGGGTAVLVDVAPDAMLSIHFESAVAQTGGGGGVLQGCKDVAAFTANAQPTLQANCGGCHAGQNTAATAATDMTRMNDLSPEGQIAACGQILSRVNLPAPNNSSIFIAPDPGSGSSHPYKFGAVDAFNTFRDQLLVWITAENQAL